jgi:hypothetical protein
VLRRAAAGYTSAAVSAAPRPVSANSGKRRRSAGISNPGHSADRRYSRGMTIAPDYSQLHRAVDRRSPVQAEALYIVVESMLGEKLPATQAGPPAPDAPRTSHRLSFTAAGSGPSDLAARAEDYLHTGSFGHPAA